MRRVIKCRWGLVPDASGTRVVEPITVLTEGAEIAQVTTGRLHAETWQADEIIELPSGFVLPGFVNLHNHCLNGPLFRGVVDDMARGASDGTLVYSLLMPLGDLAAQLLTIDEMQAVYRLAVLESLKSGVTCMLDMWRAAQPGFLPVAAELGLRAYGAPYIASASPIGVGADGAPRYVERDWKELLRQAVDLFHTYDGGPRGLTRVFLGPHGTDTCSPDVLSAVARTAEELGTGVTVHAAQSIPEVSIIRSRYGKTPLQYLDELEMLTPSVVVAHAVFADSDDLELLRASGATVANCPRTFASGATPAPLSRFVAAGVRTGIGTDSCRMDYLAELRMAGFVSKIYAGDGAAGSAETLIDAATKAGADALARPDLGRVAAACRADLIVVDLGHASMQPVYDPLRNLVWYATPADVALVMVDGVVVVRNGRHAWADEEKIIVDATAAVDKVWAEAERRGILAPVRGTRRRGGIEDAN